jgi:hypothetical protein
VWKSAIATTPKLAFRSPQLTIQQAKKKPLPVDKSAEAEHHKFVELHYHKYLVFSHFTKFPNYRYKNISVNDV